MRSAQTAYRPLTKSAETIAPRKRTAAVRLKSVPQIVAPRPRRKTARKTAQAPLPNGLNVMGLIVVILAFIGGMLVVSLNWQRNAHTLAQEEVSLRSALDHIGDERQHLFIDERRASNPGFTAARAQDAGLIEIKLDERGARAKPVAKVAKPAMTNAVAGKPLPVAPKPAKTALITPATKPATATAATKVAQPPARKTERTVIPTLPQSIVKNASVKAALAR